MRLLARPAVTRTQGSRGASRLLGPGDGLDPHSATEGPAGKVLLGHLISSAVRGRDHVRARKAKAGVIRDTNRMVAPSRNLGLAIPGVATLACASQERAAGASLQGRAVPPHALPGQARARPDMGRG
jgi:hypothetical protein